MKIRAVEIGLTAAALLTLSGCITGADRAEGDNPAYAETKLVAGEKAKYQAARKQWQSFELDFYFYDINADCFCYPMGPLQVQVRDNQVVAASHLDCDPEQGIVDLSGVYTIDGLFDLIATYLDNTDYRVVVNYHYGLGYPMDISIKRKEPLPDGDLHFQVMDIRIPVSN